MEETKALTHVGSGALASPSPQMFVQAAGQMASALADVINKQKLFANIQGKKYVTVEGWTTLASMLGFFPCEVSNEDVGGGVYVAVVELRKTDGTVVGRASAECGGDHDRVWGKRDSYARRSMAATRATSKACRLTFSWIMTLAGYASTPAEEMDFAQQQEPAQTKRQAAPPQQQTTKSAKGWDGQLPVTFGKMKGKKWADVPHDYLAWVTENMKPPAQEYAQLEIDRRLELEATKQQNASMEGDDIVDAEEVPASAQEGLFP